MNRDWKMAALNRDPSGLAMSCQSSTTITWWFWSTSQPASFAGLPHWSKKAQPILSLALPARRQVAYLKLCLRVPWCHVFPTVGGLTLPQWLLPRFCGTPELGILRHFQKSVEELTQCLKYSQEYPNWVCGCTFLFAFFRFFCGEDASRKSWPAPLSERVGGQWK